MNLQEYELIKSYTYDEYCDYLVNKYGPATGPYFTDTFWTKMKKPKQPVQNKSVVRTKEGLFLHHKQENHVASLSSPEVAVKHDYELQSAENLVPCDYLEHLFLHILICENPQPFEGEHVGANGTLTWILPTLVSYFEKKHIPLEWQIPAFNRIENDRAVYDALIDRFIHSKDIQEKCNVTEEELRNLVSDRLIFSHNEIVMNQLEDFLQNDNKALVDLGTGLGKTTTAIQYAIDHQCNCLVLCPSGIIKDGWKKSDMTLNQRSGNTLDVMSYQAFTNQHLNMDLTQYDLLICDEAHHCRGPQWGKGVRYVIENKLLKVIGLTATPADVAESIFGGNVCKGLTVVEGIEQGIIHPISYVGAYYDTDSLLDEVKNFQDQELIGQLNLAINNTPTLKDIILKNMPAGPRKCIIFTQSIEAMDQAIEILKDIYPNDEYRKIHSKMDSEDIKNNKEWFEHTATGFLCAVNMISEGAHYRGVNTVFMFRKTKSELLFQQQIGRIITLAKFDNPHAILFDLVNNANSVEVSKPLKLSIGKRKEILEQEKNFNESEQIIIKDYCAEINEILKRINEVKYLWTEEEMLILREYYPLEGQKVYQRLPGRSAAACKRQALKIGLNSLNQALPWSIDEINIMQEYYTNNFDKCIHLLPYRNKSAIYKKAESLGLKRNIQGNQFGYWSPEENEILKSFYPIEGLLVQYRLTNKSDNAILQQAHKLGLKSDRCKKPVRCIETQIVYPSVRDASRQLGVDRKGISYCCQNKPGYKTAGGYHWEYVD